jgi:methyltransferase-like protein
MLEIKDNKPKNVIEQIPENVQIKLLSIKNDGQKFIAEETFWNLIEKEKNKGFTKFVMRK